MKLFKLHICIDSSSFGFLKSKLEFKSRLCNPQFYGFHWLLLRFMYFKAFVCTIALRGKKSINETKLDQTLNINQKTKYIRTTECIKKKMLKYKFSFRT